MKWIEICVHTTNEAVEPVSNILNDLGANGVLIEDRNDLFVERPTKFGEIFELNPNNYPEEGVYVKAYYPQNDQFQQISTKLKQSLANLSETNLELGLMNVTHREVVEEDWATAWKKYYKTVRVSDRITICPSWIDYDAKSQDEIVIELDPGMAFGTGTHPTTKLSLQALDKFVNIGDTVIDVGCGSGVLSIASARLGAKHVYAFDLDDVAISSTKANATINDLEKSITIKQNDLLNGVAIEADIIVSNILAEIIVHLIPDAWKNLKTDGLLITSGIIVDKKNLVKEGMEKAGFQILAMNEMDDWVSVVAKKV